MKATHTTSPAALGSDAPQIGSASRGGTLDERVRAARILVLDDEPQNQRLIAEILAREGFRHVAIEGESEAALASIRASPPDLLLLDLQMPRISGLELLTQIADRVKGPDPLPVLVLTGDGSTAAKERALSAGARDFLTKPFEAVELTLRIRNLLQTRLLQRELLKQNERLEKQVRERTVALQEALGRAEEANRSKSKFLAVMSHELRTPLTGIISYAELLESGLAGPIDDQVREMVDRIHSAGWHLSHLIEDILDYSSGQTALDQLRFQRIDVGRLVHEAADLMNPYAQHSNSRLRVEAPRDPTYVLTEPTRLRRILFNLISNALKFSGEEEVLISVHRRGGSIEVRVQDWGIGMDAVELERIWEPFWQAEDPLTRTVGGSGLGLSIVRNQADLLGAELHVESTPGVGSIFAVRLPEDVGDELP